MRSPDSPSESGTIAETVGYVPSGEGESATLPLPLKGSLPVLPGYEVLRILGRGGMGVVYKARQIKANRVVALKMVLAGSYADDEQLARFRTEAEAIARLQHPHIVQVFEVGEHAGQPFFSLEFCGGGSLSRHLHGAPLPAREAARLVEVLAEALHAAHQKGIIHRDLKPANVLLQRDESDAAGLTPAMLKITDFGLAKRVEDAGQTASGAVMGTPSYMAPEQASGDTHHIGPTADIYALGALLYELLTGRPPFRAATTMDTLLQVLHDEPVPPRRLQPRTPRDLETICLKCLHKDASRRYATAADLAADLERWLRDEPIQARPVGRWERAAKWVRRRPASASLLAVAAALPLIALLLAGWYLERQRQFNQELQDERNHALKQKGIAERNEAEAKKRKREADEQRDEAKKQTKRAEDAYQENQLRLMQMHVVNGARLMEDGDSFAALPWLVTALKEDPAAEATRELHRDRIGAILRQSPRLARMFFHPAGMVHHVEFSPDGSKLVTTCDDHRARIWDVATNQEVCSLRHIRWSNTPRMFSKDGRQVLTISEQEVQVQDAVSGEAVRTLAVAGATGACFSPDDQRLLVSAGRGARVWEVRTGQAASPPFEEADQILDASFSPDGRWVVTASNDATARVWDIATGKALSPPLKHGQAVTHAVFSPDGKHLATTCRDAKLRLWAVTQGAARLAWEAMEAGSAEVHFSPDGSRLVSCDSMWAELHEVKTGTRISRLAHKASVYHAVFSPDGGRVATTSEDLTARIWDAATGLPVAPPLKHAKGVLETAFSPDGRLLATGCFDGTARSWDLDSSKPSFSWSGPGPLQELSPDTRYALALSEANHTVHILDSRSGKQIYGPWRMPASIRYAAFSPDSRLVLAACADRTTRLWKMASGKACCPPLKHDNDVVVAAVSPDATRVATGCKDGTVHVWDLAGGRELHPPLRHTGSLHSIQFSKDGRRLLTSGLDSRARVWDAATGQPVGPFLSHNILELGIWRVNAGGPAWNPDGNRLATSQGFRIYTGDAATGRAVGPSLDHSGGLSSLVFRADGSRLLSTSNDGTAVQWDITTGKRLTPAMRHSHFVDYGTYSPDGRRIATTDHIAAWMWDAATGLPLAPPSKAGDGNLVRFSPDGRHLFRYDVRQPGMTIWDVSPDDRPVEDLGKLAKLLSAHQLDANGGLIPLTSEELRTLWQDLEAKYPDGFDAPVEKNQRIAWHLQQAEKARSANRHPLILSHWVRALELGAKDLDQYDGDDLCLLRASAYLQRKRWDKAAPDCMRTVALWPEDHWVWVRAAPLLLQANKVKEYQNLRRDMLKRFGSTQDPTIAERVAKVSTVAWNRGGTGPGRSPGGASCSRWNEASCPSLLRVCQGSGGVSAGAIRSRRAAAPFPAACS